MTKRFLITDFGAAASTTEVQTTQIQCCIDACRAAGGGEVVIPAGTFLCGSIRLYSNMTLRLEDGATLLGSKKFADYSDFKTPTTINYLYDDETIANWHLPPYYFYAFITAFQAENIRIIGEGRAVIDGQDAFDPNGEEQFRGPMGIVLSQVANVQLEGYTFQNSANWSHELDSCKQVTIQNVNIKGGHDGFDLHHSEKITVKNCRIESGDDCFAGYDITDLYVSDCFMNSSCNPARVGGTNLVFDNCTISGPGHYAHILDGVTQTLVVFMYYAMKTDTIKADSEKILFKNCTIENAEKFVLYEHGNKWVLQESRPLHDLTLENVAIKQLLQTSTFKGNGKPATLTLRNVTVDFDAAPCFLEIDQSVDLILENVNFVKPTKITIAGGEELLVSGKTDFVQRRKG